MSGTKGEKDILRRYPVVEGLISGTTTQEGRVMNLIPEKSFVKRRVTCGFR